jgi:hypothetical protein
MKSDGRTVACIFSSRPLTEAEVRHQLAQVLEMLRQLPGMEPEEKRTYSEAEVLEGAGLRVKEIA